MKLLNLVGFFLDLSRSMYVAFIPTFKAISREPLLFFKPLELRRVYMAHVWTVYGDGIDESSKADKEKLLRGNASGVVLELGAGYGHTAQYLDKTRVTAYVALEPNVLMHATLRKTARTAGFVGEEGTFLLIGLPAGDVEGIQRALADWAATYGEQHRKLCIQLSEMNSGGGLKPQVQINTLVSVLTLCSIPDPLRTLRALVSEVLAPGGSLLFYEHVRNEREDVAWWQDTLTPLWRHFFDGCVVGLDGVRVAREAGKGEGGGEEGWASIAVWGKEGEDEESLFWHQSGRFVKAGDVSVN